MLARSVSLAVTESADTIICQQKRIWTRIDCVLDQFILRNTSGRNMRAKKGILRSFIVVLTFSDEDLQLPSEGLRPFDGTLQTVGL